MNSLDRMIMHRVIPSSGLPQKQLTGTVVECSVDGGGGNGCSIMPPDSASFRLSADVSKNAFSVFSVCNLSDMKEAIKVWDN